MPKYVVKEAGVGKQGSGRRIERDAEVCRERSGRREARVRQEN